MTGPFDVLMDLVIARAESLRRAEVEPASSGYRTPAAKPSGRFAMHTPGMQELLDICYG